jgi:hypothetical protein
VDIVDNVVEGYQKNGITGNESGTNVNISGNNVVGQGPTNGAAENGIQIGFGASGNISFNSVTDNVWAPDTISDSGDAASGILAYAASHVSIFRNIVNNSQFGIATVTDSTVAAADDTSILLNRVNATHIFSGVEVCSNHNRVEGNFINGSDEAGIHLDSSCTGTGNSNSVKANFVNSACAGILEGTGTTSNKVNANRFFNVTTTILQADQCSTPDPTASIAVTSTAKVSQAPRHLNPIRP